MSAGAAWAAAQRHERGYWCPTEPLEFLERRQEEEARHWWYAGLLGINPRATKGKRVLDLGCGPMALSYWDLWHLEHVTALDPIRFDADDEARYDARSDFTRVLAPAEGFEAGRPIDEVWSYNVLQHVVSPALVLDTMTRNARERVRLFEWVNEPQSIVHLHVIQPEAIRHTFRDWICEMATSGRCVTPRWGQEFYAAVYRRRA